MTAFLVPLVAGLLLLTGLVLDGGLALATWIRASGQAESAARAGAQCLDLAAYRADGTIRLDSTAAAAAVHQHLGAQASAEVTVSGNTVTVTVTSAQPTQLLGLIGIRHLVVSADGSAQPQLGPAEGQP